MRIIISLLLNAFALIITSQIVPGFSLDSFATAILVAIILGVINTFIRPVLLILTAPINILTLGLFTFVINALMLLLTSVFVQGMHIQDLLTAVLAAIVLAVVSTALSMLLSTVAGKKR